MLLTKISSLDIASNIQRIWANQLISVPPDIHEKTRRFLMILVVTEVN